MNPISEEKLWTAADRENSVYSKVKIERENLKICLLDWRIINKIQTD